MRRNAVLIGCSATAVAAAGGLVAAALRPPPPAATSIGAAREGPTIIVHVGPGGGGEATPPAGKGGTRPTGGAPRVEEHTASSLAGAQKVLEREGASRATVLVKGGTYGGESLEWAYSPAGGEIAIRPEPGTGRVVYDGGGRDGSWMTVLPGPARMHVSGMTVQNYTSGGIEFLRDEASGKRSAGGSVKNMTFRRIGTRYGSGSEGDGAVHLVGSRHMTIRNNAFANLENDTVVGGIHGVRLSDGASGNSVTGNAFSRVSGDPVQAGEGASGNRVVGNRFQASGWHGVFSYYASPRAPLCGTGNYFAVNTYGKAYPRPGRAKSFEKRPVAWDGRGGSCTPAPIEAGRGNRYAPDLRIDPPG